MVFNCTLPAVLALWFTYLSRFFYLSSLFILILSHIAYSFIYSYLLYLRLYASRLLIHLFIYWFIFLYLSSLFIFHPILLIPSFIILIYYVSMDRDFSLVNLFIIYLTLSYFILIIYHVYQFTHLSRLSIHSCLSNNSFTHIYSFMN